MQVRTTPVATSRRVQVARACEKGTKTVPPPTTVSRRDAAAMLSAAAMVVGAKPARAGIFGPPKEEVYQTETQAVLDSVKETLALEKGDPTREEKIATLRKETAQWVAKYRRDPSVAGKQSYSNMYTALNAIAGHYNNFGTKAPIPKKRLERVLVEINTAENALARGR
eukprot:scaffold519_cov331-Pavlova_lutheri.AAC.30